jgi:zinc transport system ATP-binding protein
MKRKEIIKLENVSFSYTNKEFLKDINLSIYEDDFLGIIGPNGGGKTTLLKLILGLLQPKEGNVKILGKSAKETRSQIGYLSQFKNIDFDFPITAYEIVLISRLGNKIIKKYSIEDREIVKKIMKELGIWKLKDKKLNEISGGEKQRIFVARALANEPKILILDEPMSNLDISIQEDFYKTLKELNKGIAIVIVDHDLEMMSKYVKEVVCVNKCDTHTIRYHNANSLKMRKMYHD